MESGGTALVLDTTSTDIRLTASNSEVMGKFIKDGAVQLYYDNSQKLSTTSSGVTITGAIRVGADNAANELDDYEEGTFTPAYSQSGGDVLRTGRYTKVGNMVTIFIRAQYTQTSSTTAMGAITGLPFTILSETGNGTMVFREFSTTGDLHSATLSPNNTATNNIVNFTNTNTFTAGGEIGIGVEFSYRVA